MNVNTAKVLILIILEYYIRAKFPKTIYLDEVRVLILIILEYYIRDKELHRRMFQSCKSLNPYYTGILYTRADQEANRLEEHMS